MLRMSLQQEVPAHMFTLPRVWEQVSYCYTDLLWAFIATRQEFTNYTAYLILLHSAASRADSVNSDEACQMLSRERKACLLSASL